MTNHTPPEFDRVPTFFSASAANPTPPKVNGALVFGFIGWVVLIIGLIAWGVFLS